MNSIQLLDYRLFVCSLSIASFLILAYMATAKTKENKLTRQIILITFIINLLTF